MPRKNQSIKRTYMTPAFRLSYPNLFDAVPDLSNRMRFNCVMLFPKAELVAKYKAENHPAAPYMSPDNCSAFWNEIVAIAKSNFGPEVQMNTLKLVTFKDGDAPKPDGKVDETNKGHFAVRTTSKDKPDCRGQDQNVRADEGEFYAGCWVRAVLTVAPFFEPQRGVTTYLAGIQKIADDDAFSGRPRVEDVFDAVAVDGAVAQPSLEPGAMPWAQ